MLCTANKSWQVGLTTKSSKLTVLFARVCLRLPTLHMLTTSVLVYVERRTQRLLESIKMYLHWSQVLPNFIKCFSTSRFSQNNKENFLTRSNSKSSRLVIIQRMLTLTCMNRFNIKRVSERSNGEVLFLIFVHVFGTCRFYSLLIILSRSQQLDYCHCCCSHHCHSLRHPRYLVGWRSVFISSRICLNQQLAPYFCSRGMIAIID